jgi:hypothetical protein
MFRRARARARSRSPPCACKAPQQSCPSAATVSNPLAWSVRIVARFTRSYRPLCTHPSRIATRARTSRTTGPVRSPTSARTTDRAGAVAASMARPNLALRNAGTFGKYRAPIAASPVARRARPIAKNTDLSAGEDITTNRARVSSPGGAASAAVCRASSSSVPYSTPEGHTGSHARHPRHRSMWVRNASDAGSRRPSTTAFMRCSLPRGESFSSPSRLYVGQAGRQKPQCTHGISRSRWISSSSARRVATVDAGDLAGDVTDDSATALPWGRRPARGSS